MTIVATYNIKGGVGKTATAVNLAWLAAGEKMPTLIWDLDPQGATTFYLRVKPKVQGGGKGLIGGKRNLAELIKETDFEHLDLLPADFSYRHLDLLLDDEKKPSRRLRKLLKPLSERYRWIFLDCPPSISLVSEAVFQAADVLLVPLIPTTLSLRTLEQLTRFRSEQKLDGLNILPFFSMVDRRKKLHREILTELPRQYPDLLRAEIPFASDIEKMGIHRAPLGVYSPGSRALEAYRALWREVRSGLGPERRQEP
ncbi:MAG: AAA family ATPase [Deltaproteobacteria bacterium]|nr:AAA family ATPase [Deltaproteobacteria bacterium]